MLVLFVLERHVKVFALGSKSFKSRRGNLSKIRDLYKNVKISKNDENLVSAK